MKPSSISKMTKLTGFQVQGGFNNTQRIQHTSTLYARSQRQLALYIYGLLHLQITVERPAAPMTSVWNTEDCMQAIYLFGKHIKCNSSTIECCEWRISTNQHDVYAAPSRTENMSRKHGQTVSQPASQPPTNIAGG